MVTEAGKMKYRKTALGVSPATFIKDATSLDLDPYDLVVCDYEPVTSWASKARGRELIGIGHQYAFGKGTPITGDTPMSRLVMQQFAPVDVPVGLHWAAFDENVLPPILDLPDIDVTAPADHILVYLPFEDQNVTTAWLQGFPTSPLFNIRPRSVTGCKVMWCDEKPISMASNATLRCKGVICNTGFELISECLQWKKPVLTRPLTKQMEQLSNAAALEQLGYATTMQSLETQTARKWFDAMPEAPDVHFKDVAGALAEWLARGASRPVAELSRQLWS